MLTISHNDPFSQRLAGYAQNLDNAAGKWTRIDSSITSADRSVDSADFQFDQAWYPQRQASYDNERTDSSWHGRDLDRYFRQGDQEIERADSQIQQIQHDLGSLKKEVKDTDSGLDQLIAEMKAVNDSRLPVVLQAADEIAKAEGNFNGVSGSFQRFDSSSNWADQAVWRADSPIRQISWDRPGQNVSYYAHQVGNSLRDIEREVRTMDWALSDADRQGDQGQSQLLSAAHKLRQASTTTP